ncbi:DinB family protein [Alloacidobacterium sp.]|uniref:DinB family protein n=1 Tax=Alloacidobacterium sp. TaxID=2951999 RepID=UPI002D66694F|nr:DinB family protein [Alloacidobacterium sp.]HYK34820.1 DinB family protein [Alloacidobacterium sp.]
MPTKTAERTLPLADSLVRALDINCRITRYLAENLDPKAWHAPTPDGKGRNVAAIVAHIHNVRRMWLKATGSKEIPEELKKETLNAKEALAGLDKSAAALHALVAESLATGVRIKGFKPDTAAFVGYIIAHDSHHRGQIAMLARQAGFPLPKQVEFGMWEWGVR